MSTTTNKLIILLALGLAAAGQSAQTVSARSTAKQAAEIYEGRLAATGLARLGVDAAWQIVLPDNPALVERTAAEVLQKFLRRGGVEVGIVMEARAAGGRRFLLGRESSVQAVRRLGDKGDMKIRDVSAADDGFHLKRAGQDIVVAGANPRGVLYGVYAFEEFVEDGAKGRLDVKQVPYFRQRGSGPQYSFNPFVNLALEDFPEEKAEYLSRLGINQLTDQGVGASLHDFVDSDMFRFQKSTPDPRSLQPRPADLRRKVKAMSALCQKYGIDHYIFLSEPVVPTGAARIEKYPPEAIGAVQRPWGGSKTGSDPTLCVSSPIVKQHLRNMMGKFVREYPDVKGVIFYNMDMAHWICTPDLCPRCKAVCTDSPGDVYNPWETQAALITLLTAAAHEQSPAFDFRLWGAVHYHGERFEKMIRAAQGYNSLLSGWNASDRSLMVPDAAERDPAFLTTLQIARERGIPAHVAFEFNNLETVPKSLAFPFHVADALQKFKRWDVRNTTEIFGTVPEHNSINALVVKAWQWDPEQNPREVLAGLARRQFGEASGKLMYRAWEEMERGFDSWDKFQFGPLDGSQFYLSMGTTVALLKPVIPTTAEDYGYIGILTKVEPWRAEGYQRFKSREFQESMNRMSDHFAKAADYARQAVTVASHGEYVRTAYYDGPNGRPTHREYAELNYAALALANALCRQKRDMVTAFHLLTELENARRAGDQKTVAERKRQHHELVRGHIVLQEQFRELLTGFARMEPTYARASLTGQEITEQLAQAQVKIDKMRQFLAAEGAAP